MTMSFRQMNLNVFARQPNPHVLFQPRMEPWFHWHQLFGGLPERYTQSTVKELYQDVDCSMRYVHYYTGMPDPIERRFGAGVIVRERSDAKARQIIYETPLGDLIMTQHWTVDHTWRTVGFPVRTPDDLRALTWLYTHTQFHLNAENLRQGADYMGDLGEPQFWVPKSPYQALAQQWMTLPNLIYALQDDPSAVHDAMRAIDDAYDPLYAELAGGSQARIINFGENIHDQLVSPRFWETYFIPFYEKRCAQLHAAGIYTYVHIDGYFSSLLPYLASMPFDGYEALTPVPQGDVTLDEIAAHIGDKVLLDGIPAVFFMPQYSDEELMACVERLVALFHPRLVLGISDELPQGTGPEALERVRRIAAWARAHG
jgi:hypothetical protein